MYNMIIIKDLNYFEQGEQRMAIYYLVRHGQPDYSPCDERGYIGHGMVMRTITYAEHLSLVKLLNATIR